jgi:hypothetical protein
MPRVHAWRRTALLAASAIPTLLPGCVVYLAQPQPTTEAAPQVIAATEDEISFGISGLMRPDILAGQYCRQFAKEAILHAVVRTSDQSDERIVYYSCVWRTTAVGTTFQNAI